jgi:hypothetical protein
VANNFREDEPLFATGLTEPLHEQHGDIEHQDEAVHQEWEREHALQDRMNLTAAFASEPAMEHEDIVEEVTAHDMDEPEPEAFAAASGVAEPGIPSAPYDSPTGSVEEQVIEEEEADITHYVEDLEEDAVFDEMEEETSAAADYQSPRTLEIAATGEPPLHAAAETADASGEQSVEETALSAAGEIFAGEGEAEAEACRRVVGGWVGGVREVDRGRATLVDRPVVRHRRRRHYVVDRDH